MLNLMTISSKIDFSEESNKILENKQNTISKLHLSNIFLQGRIDGLNKKISDKTDRNNSIKEEIKIAKSDFTKKKSNPHKKKLNIFFELLVNVLQIFYRTIRQIVSILILNFYKFWLKISEWRFSNNARKISNLNSEISFVYSQREKGLELLNNEWFTIDEINTKVEAALGLLDDFESMSDRNFEFFIADLLKEIGYQNVKVTPQTADYGVDVIAKMNGEMVAVQCKKFNINNHVSNVDIQKLLGSMLHYHATHAIFVTTSYYTKNAQEQAKSGSIELWDRDTLKNLIKKYFLKSDVAGFTKSIEQLRADELGRIRKRIEDGRRRAEKEEQERTCPRCGGGKRRTNEYCSQCTRQIERKEHRESKRQRDDDFGGDLSSVNWNPFDR